MLRSKRHSFIAGFSLVEVLVTFTILALGVVALGRVQGLMFKGGDFAEQQAEASSIAHAKIEELRNFTSISGSGASYNNIASGTQSVSGRSATFNLVWTVTTNTDPNYKTVNTQVTWTDADGVSNNVSLSSIIAEVAPDLQGRGIQSGGGGGSVPFPT